MVSAALPHPAPREYSEAEFLAELDRELAATFSSQSILDVAARPLVTAPSAKRARARLVFLLGRAFDLAPSPTLDIALTLELVHSASLLHDDVLDAALSRRGLPTANHLHGDVVAVLAGDLVLTRAMRRVLGLGAEVGLAVVDVIAEMSRAVALEVASRGDVVDRETWRAMAEGKTGALFGGVARLVGLAAGLPAEAEVYDRALRQLGVAFQAADDLMDLVERDGAEARPAVDLRDGNPSLAITMACELDGALAEALRGAWRRREEAAALAPRVLATGTCGAVEAYIATQVAEARERLALELRHPRRGRAAARLLAWAEGLVRVASELGVSEARRGLPAHHKESTA